MSSPPDLDALRAACAAPLDHPDGAWLRDLDVGGYLDATAG